MVGRFVERSGPESPMTLGSACASRAGAGVLASANLEHVHRYKKSETPEIFPRRIRCGEGAPTSTRGRVRSPNSKVA